MIRTYKLGPTIRACYVVPGTELVLREHTGYGKVVLGETRRLRDSLVATVTKVERGRKGRQMTYVFTVQLVTGETAETTPFFGQNAIHTPERHSR